MDAACPLRPRVVTEAIRIRGGRDTAALLRTALRVVAAGAGPVAVVGGLAVTCRLRHAHRATTDVDTVAEDRTPAVVEVLGRLDGAERDPDNPDRVLIDGVPVDVIATMPLDDVDIDQGVEELFVFAHRFALESADHVSVVLEGPEPIEGVLPLASAAGLVATKLCGVQGYRRPPDKKATDAYDLYRLLDYLDADGEMALELTAQGDPLRRCIRDAAGAVLRNAAGVVRNLFAYGGAPLGRVTVDEFSFVIERFVDGLDSRDE